MPGETRFFGYNSDAEYRQAVAAEIDAREAESREVSKPLSASAFAREAAGPTSDDLMLQATEKLTQALTAHKGQMGVNDAYGGLQQMLDGSSDPEAAAMAVIAFASEYPAYADQAVAAMDEVWGDWGREALAETVNEVAFAEAVRQGEQEQERFDQHVAHRADVLRGLSNEIAMKDGEAVRQITSAMAGQDETLLYGDDVQAAATLLGYGSLARAGKASALKEGFLREFDREVEANGLAGRLSAPGERERYQQQAAATTAEIVGFDPATEFERGHQDAMRRVHEGVVGLPFDEAAFNEEIAKYERPEHSTTEAMNARDARERADHIERFGAEPGA